MSIPVTLERAEFRLTAETPPWQREEYGLPDAFVPGDGVIRFTTRPTVPGYHVHAVRLYAKTAQFETDEGQAWLEQRAMFLASEHYEQRYGLPIHQDGTETERR